jgi:predicted nucleic acid-binding protein
VIFVDTSFWVATALRRDGHHEEAVSLLRAHPDSLVTSNQVRGETWTFLRRKDGHRVAVEYLDTLDKLESSRLEIARISANLEREALEWLRRHDEREYSFVDATSFILMNALRIRDAFAFDGDFTSAGFRELRA